MVTVSGIPNNLGSCNLQLASGTLGTPGAWTTVLENGSSNAALGANPTISFTYTGQFNGGDYVGVNFTGLDCEFNPGAPTGPFFLTVLKLG